MGKISKSIIMVFILTVLCLFALPAQAQYAGGTGDPCDPYQINDPCQLNAVGQHPEDWDKHFVLTADIDMAGYSYTRAVIAPDTSFSGGFQGTAFTGTFGGAGFVISNLTIDAAGAGHDYLGLFGKIEGLNAEVKNLGAENINVTGDDYLGGLCGENYNGRIINCYITGSVSGGRYSYYLGGLCGYNSNGSRISNCYSTGAIIGGVYSSYLGGLCGFNFNSSRINNCYSTGSVSGGDYSSRLGGLCGCNRWAACCGGSSISDCYSTGPVIGGDYSEYLGGLCGDNYDSIIINCYATGSVSGSYYLGGLCGSCYGSISNSFWDIETSGPDNGIGTPKTTAEMQTQGTFTDAGWDFVGEDVNGTDDFWRMCVDGIDYPKLSWQFLVSDFVCSDGVDLADFAVLADTWSLSSSQTGYNDLCDLVDDDVIDLADLAVFAENWLAGKM